MNSAALVTGAARGLGLAIGTLLAELGQQVVLLDRDPVVERSAEDLRARGFAADAVVADLSRTEDLERVRDEVAGLATGLHTLVNNAGITRDARLTKMDPADFTAVIRVNLVAPMALTYRVRELMVEGASVVNISSRAALGNFGQVNYVSAKSGLVGFTRALALAWSPQVRVNAVAPGLIDSAMTRAMPSEVLAGLVAKVPARRMGSSVDVAQAVEFLASPRSSYVTGQVLMVCGGRSLAP